MGRKCSEINLLQNDGRVWLLGQQIWCQGGSRNWRSQGFCNSRKIVMFRGTRGARRPADNSPICTDASALSARRSRLSLEFKGSLVDESSPSHGETRELPKESQAKVDPDSGKHSVYTHFPKDRNCDVCLTRNCILQKTCWCRRATKFSVKEVNHAIIIDTLLWYKTWQLSGYNSTHFKKQLLKRPRRA